MHHLPVGVVPVTRDITTPTVARTYLVTTVATGTTTITTTACNVSTGCIVTACVGATSAAAYVIPPSTQASLDLGTNAYRSLYTPTEDRLAAIRQRAQAAANALGLEAAPTHGPLGPPVVTRPSPEVALPSRTTQPAKVASSSEKEEDYPKERDWYVAVPRTAGKQKGRAVAEALGLGLPSTQGPLGSPVVPKPPPVVAPPLRTTRPAKQASSSVEDDSHEKGDWTVIPARRRRSSARSSEAMETSSESAGATSLTKPTRTYAGKRKGRTAERRSPPKMSAPRSGSSSSRTDGIPGASSGSGTGKLTSSVPSSRAIPPAVATSQKPLGQRPVTSRGPRGAQAAIDVYYRLINEIRDIYTTNNTWLVIVWSRDIYTTNNTWLVIVWSQDIYTTNNTWLVIVWSRDIYTTNNTWLDIVWSRDIYTTNNTWLVIVWSWDIYTTNNTWLVIVWKLGHLYHQ
uniref:(California timema) hypothetical protein n=1 Tax=Timema californicum TaxID=61474 RepID=A0A7R9PDL2_TIMCA|nr:unnamed protein product [Timema californicum]